jgi:hypothetical protein
MAGSNAAISGKFKNSLCNIVSMKVLRLTVAIVSNVFVLGFSGVQMGDQVLSTSSNLGYDSGATVLPTPNMIPHLCPSGFRVLTASVCICFCTCAV